VAAYSTIGGDLDGSYIAVFLSPAALPTALAAIFTQGSRFS
jgi:hypothetical protein